MFRKIVYSSPVEGFVHCQGKPLANVKVTRLLQSGGFENGENQDHVQTDAQGKFRFETVSERRFLRPDLLSANPRVTQTIEVNFETTPYTIWVYSKLDFDLGTESADGIIRITAIFQSLRNSLLGASCAVNTMEINPYESTKSDSNFCVVRQGISRGSSARRPTATCRAY